MPILLKYWTKSTGRGGLRKRQASQVIFFSLLALLVLQQGASAVGQQPNAAARTPFARPGDSNPGTLLLTPGDLIDLEVFNTPELSAPKLRIAQDGTVALPVVGNVKIAGLTPGQANTVVEQRLKDAQIMSSPSVTILVLDFFTGQGFDVLGEVKNPGIYPLLGTHSLYDALAAAGGVSPTNGATVTVTHHDDPAHPLILHVTDPGYSQLLSSTTISFGDVVEVSRADAVFVVGDVLHSGQFPMTNGKPITALSALALAQGPNKTAKLGSASIVRKTASGGAQIIPINLYQVEKATVNDPLLLPDDVLVIPRSGLKAFLEVAIPGIPATVLGAVVYSSLR